jgi:hypothetical protein
MKKNRSDIGAMKFIAYNIIAVAVILYSIEVVSFGIRWSMGSVLSSYFTKNQAENERLALIQDLIKQGAPVDRRPASQAIRDMSDAGTPVHPFLSPADVYEFSKQSAGRLGVSGLSGRTVISGGEFGPWVFNTHDQYGFNNRPEDWARDGSTVFVGASMVYGWSVERDKTFVGLLRAAGRPVVNFGFPPGLGSPDFYLAGLREYLALTKPKYVVWTLWDNIEMNLPGRYHDIIARYQDAVFSQDLASHQAELDQAYLAAITPFINDKSGYKFLPVEPDGSHLSDVAHLRNLRVILDRARRVVMPAAAPQVALIPENVDRSCVAGWPERHVRILNIARQIVAPTGAQIVVAFYPSGKGCRGSFRRTITATAIRFAPSAMPASR